MFHRFPPISAPVADPSFLTSNGEIFAKLKQETEAGKRTVFVTEHTLIFVTKGVKLLHLPNETVEAGPNTVILLKKGIYVMAEYIEEGLNFEALMLFLPVKLLKSIATEPFFHSSKTPSTTPYTVFNGNELVQAFKAHLRLYFDKPVLYTSQLLALKQREILLLLMNGVHQREVVDFITAALSTEPADLDEVMRTYLLQPVTLEDLASLTNRSLATFKRDFRRIYHMPPRQWINGQRLQHARMLLENTRLPVGEIAGDCGYDSTSHFIRIFKKKFGHTPQAIRAEMTID
ncbi:helix-turn-helix transcriptional regulator [Chitinophaga varians]|uniref:Helix-turn-helix transcriptional regulator n=1 Tax=Chitinophaga varians TaxID=2202339 RepID=A0A847RXF0_9BACT|nr:AraC family transcriptional regulator [Chitinophaga varians]NLR65568.1 helix-turn-helix transcriptional regulator [Chitinophaga varians]